MNYVCGTELNCNTIFLSFFPKNYSKAGHHTVGATLWQQSSLLANGTDYYLWQQ